MSRRADRPAIDAYQGSSSQHAIVTLSKDETILLSSNGDVLSCRCRTSPYPHASEGWQGYSWHDELAVICCEADCDDLSTQMQDTAICSSWTTSHKRPVKASRLSLGGLMGGSPAQIAVSPYLHPQHHNNSHHHYHHSNGRGHGHGHNQVGVRVASLFRENIHRIPSPEKSNNMPLSAKAQKAFRTQPLRSSESYVDEDSIIPIRSFDYSHFADGGNDMLPPDNYAAQHQQSQSTSDAAAAAKSEQIEWQSKPKKIGPQFIHGVPTFLRSFLNVKVTQVSAHPLGSHVLLTSDAGLLYSYGLNDYGQLGIGVRTLVSGYHRGYIMTPTIVTPLLENGGKAIACAAGINHSLVVVMTEERRLVKTTSFDPTFPRTRNTESFVYHQIYGFGRNDSMKIGLVSPKIAYVGSTEEMEAVTLPRRVALRCKVRPTNDDSFSQSNQGVFCIRASAEHSAALVRRASGDVELYTWGSAMYGALGLPHVVGDGPDSITNSTMHSAVESNNGQGRVNVVPVPSFVSTLSRKSILEARVSSLLLGSEGEYPIDVSLGRRCTFVLTSLGRCFSFGTSEEGMLGLGSRILEVQEPSEICFPKMDGRIRSVSAGAVHVLATSDTGAVFGWGDKFLAGLCSGERLEGAADLSDHVGNNIQWTPKLLKLSPTIKDKLAEHVHRDKVIDKIDTAFAGYDSSVFVTESGKVLSSGRNSGRLGLGEMREDLQLPRPMYGGLRLWQKLALRSNPATGRILIAKELSEEALTTL